jgi:hypothetical protein
MARVELVPSDLFLKLKDQYYNRKILFTIGIDENQKICGGRVVGLAVKNRKNVKVLSYLNDIVSKEDIENEIPPYCIIVETSCILFAGDPNGREQYNYLYQLYLLEKE